MEESAWQLHWPSVTALFLVHPAEEYEEYEEYEELTKHAVSSCELL
jgi:hypothetical protein